MAFLEPDLSSWLRLPVAVGIFVLPGWLLSRTLRSPYPALTTFLGSAAIFFNGILLLDAVRVPLNAVSITLLVGLVCLLLARRAFASQPSTPAPKAATPLRPVASDWLWVIPVAGAAVSIGLRTIFDPLAGLDNATRWDYLARLMMDQGSLAHYPPVTGDDFRFYSWCDGIPPLVPVLNFWIYAATGSAAPVLTAARVVAEMVLIGQATYRLASRLWGNGAGWPALATLATSSLMLWSCAMGQETGLLALSLAALVLLLADEQQRPGLNTGLWAGVAAGVGAISREYGLAYILFGGGVLLGQRAGWPTIRRFSLVAGAVAGPWYLRNWIVTGNPLFPHTLGGLFPGNPIHDEMMRAIANYWGINAGYFDPWHFPRVLSVLAGGLLLLGLVGAVRAGRRGLTCVLGMALIAGLWWIAIPFTAGGWNYANRVLAPALVLAGALAGWVVGLPRPLRLALQILLLVLAADAGRRAWLLPAHPYAPAWPYALDLWRQDRAFMETPQLASVWAVLIAAAGGREIVVDHPSHHVQITRRGGHATPWFSPKVRSLFAENRTFAEVQRELNANGVRFIVLRTGEEIAARFYPKFPFLRELTTRQEPVTQVHGLRIYDLDLLVPPPSPGTPP